jgi:hypothetical protein
MEIARMNYYFTGLIILALTILALFVEPAYPKNEYLNEYGVRCGEFETRVEAEDRETDYTYGDSDYESDNYRLSFTYRKYLGTDCKTSKENVQLKQQLELMKMCNKVNRNPSLAYNENFALLVSKCRGVIPTKAEENRPVEKNTWKGMKKEYLESNPDAKTMDNTTLKMPPKDYILPLPKPKDD